MSIVPGPASVRLELPRDQWEQHPRFPEQTLLLGSHANFRKTSRMLVGRAASGADAVSIHWVFGVWKRAMHSHERYEEHKLYPYLTHRWDRSFDTARAGHEALAAAEAEVLARSLDAGPATSALVDALCHHDEVLIAHLALEEDLVIPALLALELDEFEAFLRSDGS